MSWLRAVRAANRAELMGFGKSWMSSGVAVAARSSSFAILCDQLEHTQKDLEQLQREIDQFLNEEPKATGMLGIPDSTDDRGGPAGRIGGSHTLHAHGPVVAYVGLDPQVKPSGNGKGGPGCPDTAAAECAASCTSPRCRAFPSKHLPFRLTTQRLVARRMKKGMAVGAFIGKVDCRRPSDPDGGEVQPGESGHVGRELAARLVPCLHGADPQRFRPQSLWTSSKG